MKEKSIFALILFLIIVCFPGCTGIDFNGLYDRLFPVKQEQVVEEQKQSVDVQEKQQEEDKDIKGDESE